MAYGSTIGAAGRLISAADVKRIDAAAAALDPQGGLAALMRRAGAAVAASAEARFSDRSGAAIVLAGPGMNGGDGAVAAQLLRERGREATVILSGAPQAGGAASQALESFRAAGGEVVSAEDASAAGRLSGAAYLIDALFGIGLSRPIAGAAAALIEAANAAAAHEGGPPVLSVDIPSGVASDTGRRLGAAIRAAATVSFMLPKRGHRLDQGALLSGEVEIADIGAAQAAMQGFDEAVFENGPALFGRSLRKAPDAHKYRHGHALVASGGFGATGAARLAARGALRIGAGLVTVAAPKAALLECACQLTAIMLRAAERAEDFAALLADARINAALIGPGHAAHRGGAARTRDFVLAVLATPEYRAGARAAVLDADALSAWDDPSPLFAALKAGRSVLTPHGGEFARLFPDLAARLKDPAQAARFGKIEAARAAAERSGAAVLLKGFDTVIAAPDGRVAVQCAAGQTAAPWLATAGAGDVLAGFIAGLTARGFPPFEAACAGAWAHLQAGRAAGPFAIAEDLPETLTLEALEPTSD